MTFTKLDWQAAMDRIRTEERIRLGDPPTFDQVLAYVHGELSAAEENRIRELLVAYPELVRAITAELQRAWADPGDPDYVTDEEFAERWRDLQKRIRRARRTERMKDVLPWLIALAAALTLVTVETWNTARTPTSSIVTHVLEPLPMRCANSDTVIGRPTSDYIMLALGSGHFMELDRGYKIEIREHRPNGALLWTGTARSNEYSTIDILVPRRFLRPGRYVIDAYAPDGTKLHYYWLRVLAGPGTPEKENHPCL